MWSEAFIYGSNFQLQKEGGIPLRIKISNFKKAKIIRSADNWMGVV
jgi:hypothetical protein